MRQPVVHSLTLRTRADALRVAWGPAGPGRWPGPGREGEKEAAAEEAAAGDVAVGWAEARVTRMSLMRRDGEGGGGGAGGGGRCFVGV